MTTFEELTYKLAIADELRLRRSTILTPQDLPGKYGRVMEAIDRVLKVTNCPALLAGEWAVWRHGYLGRVAQDVDIVLPAARIEEFLRVASVSGFEVLTVPEGRWPKLEHRATGIRVDVLPEGERPGSTAAPAPTTIRGPETMGASSGGLQYLGLPETIELKLAAGRQRDLADVVELLRANPDEVVAIRAHLTEIHEAYVTAFDRCLIEAQQQDQ